VEWHVWHVVGNPALACGGLLVPWKSFKWHATQLAGVLWNLPPKWQAVQRRLACAPVSAKPVNFKWSNFALNQESALWQA
jgi:hypothetical protein